MEHVIVSVFILRFVRITLSLWIKNYVTSFIDITVITLVFIIRT